MKTGDKPRPSRVDAGRAMFSHRSFRFTAGRTLNFRKTPAKPDEPGNVVFELALDFGSEATRGRARACAWPRRRPRAWPRDSPPSTPSRPRVSAGPTPWSKPLSKAACPPLPDSWSKCGMQGDRPPGLRRPPASQRAGVSRFRIQMCATGGREKTRAREGARFGRTEFVADYAAASVLAFLTFLATGALTVFLWPASLPATSSMRAVSAASDTRWPSL